MAINLRVSSAGAVTIPPELAAKYGVKPGGEIVLEETGSGLMILPAQKHEELEKPLPESYADDLGSAISAKNLETGIRFIKGVGPRLSALLEKRGVLTVEDAIYFLPLRYEDRRGLSPIAALKPGATQVFYGSVVSAGMMVARTGRRFFEAVVMDDSGSITLKWFNSNAAYMKRLWTVGKRAIITGEVSQFGYQREVHHPDVEWVPDGKEVDEILASDPVNFGRIVPVYPLTDGLSQKVVRKVMREVVSSFLPYLRETVPAEILSPPGLPPLRESLHALHLPTPDIDLNSLNEGSTPFHKAIAFDEFFFWEAGMALKKRGVMLEEGISFRVSHRYTRELAKLLPFELTAAQKRVLSEIKTEMISPHPMHRLVQGDVGSGKTIVALMAALLAVENDYQVAIMAPSEILAEQHWHTIHRWCDLLGIPVLLITAGMKGREKREALMRIADGSAKIIIGTHAIIQEKVDFSRLGLGIIDEQHRFGVLQKGVLRKKGVNPDILVMTATPIPRTLAMTLYGDLSLSVIDELPPGRKPVETKIAFESRRAEIYSLIKSEIAKGRQAYIVYPLVEESEKSDLKAATEMAGHLGSDIFPDLRVGLLHGRMTPEEKERVMSAFNSHELDILVSTTVIEVGVDVPNATLMLVEHAERFGLSQLHQLRGRVGRGEARSRCILLTGGRLSEDAEKRLKIMESTNDGFRIAEADLEIRGPGDFLGTRQSGLPEFRVASIIRDRKLLEDARNCVERLIESDPDLSAEKNRRIRGELVRRWGARLELAAIA